MLLDQAIFTSIRGRKGSGYQIAGHSPGVRPDELKELSTRSPSHEALVERHEAARSISCWVMPRGRWCICLTVHSGPEPSGRGGWRVYTHSILADEEAMALYDYHPWRLLASLHAQFSFQPLEAVPEALPSLRMVGPSKWFSSHATRQILKQIPAESLATIIHHLLEGEHVVVFTASRQESLAVAVLDLLPQDARPAITFSTGLRYSARRPFRLLIVPRQPCAADRTGDLKTHCRVDLHRPTSRAELPIDSWASELLPMLKDERYADIAFKLGQTYEPDAMEAAF